RQEFRHTRLSRRRAWDGEAYPRPAADVSAQSAKRVRALRWRLGKAGRDKRLSCHSERRFGPRGSRCCIEEYLHERQKPSSQTLKPTSVNKDTRQAAPFRN